MDARGGREEMFDCSSRLSIIHRSIFITIKTPFFLLDRNYLEQIILDAKKKIFPFHLIKFSPNVTK